MCKYCNTRQLIDQLSQSQLTQPFHDQTQSNAVPFLHQLLTRSPQFALENTFFILSSTVLDIDCSVAINCSVAIECSSVFDSSSSLSRQLFCGYLLVLRHCQSID
jgi:hypothetical protein